MSATFPCPALVLTAGFGTRFRPLSYVRAKPAVPVAGQPLVCRILGWLAAEGVTNTILNLHYKPDTITAVVGDGADLGLRVRYSWENPILGSAGGPRKALPLLDAARFLIVNGDTLCRVDLTAMLRQHEASGALVTMALVANPDPGHYGGVEVGEGGRVRSFPPPGRGGGSTMHFVGVQIAESSVFANLAIDRPAETVREIYPALMAENPTRVQAFLTDAAFRDIGTPSDYLATCLALAVDEELRELPTGVRAAIDPSARIVRTAIWDDVTIGAGSNLVDCVIADGVRIPAGASLSRCAVVAACGRTASAGETLRGDLLIAGL